VIFFENFRFFLSRNLKNIQNRGNKTGNGSQLVAVAPPPYGGWEKSRLATFLAKMVLWVLIVL
jgi:hypothetical protein